CIFRFNFSKSFFDFFPWTFSLLKTTCPPVASCRRMIVRPVVDFPHPDSPTRPNVSPLLISNDMSSTALTMFLRPSLKCFCRFFTSKTFSCSISLHHPCHRPLKQSLAFCAGPIPADQSSVHVHEGASWQHSVYRIPETLEAPSSYQFQEQICSLAQMHLPPADSAYRADFPE